MEIKRLIPSDAQQYRSLMLKAYEQDPSAFTSSASERTEAALSWWESRLTTGSDANTVVVGAFNLATLVGTAGIAFGTRDKLRHKATVFGMYVDSSFRGSGIASQLLRALLDEAKSRHCISIIQLTVSEGNEVAQRLYTNTGKFTRFGVEPYALKMGDSYISKIHMWRKSRLD